MKFRISLVLVVLLTPALAMAQLLSQQVPDDAVLFVAWRGSDEMGPGYDASNLKKIIDASDIPRLINDFLPKVMKRIGQEDRNVAEVTNLISVIGSSMWRHSSAFYFGGIDASRPGQPMPKMAILCDAKADAPALTAELQRVIQRAGRLPVRVRVTNKETLVVVEIGNTGIDQAMSGKGLTLAGSAKFKEALSKTQLEPVTLIYLNGLAFVKTLADLVESSGDPGVQQMWPKVSEALGIGGLQYAICTGGFSGSQWSGQTFIAAPAPRTGLLAMLEAKPLSNEILGAIPSTATVAAAGHFDLAGLLGMIREGLGKVEPMLQQQFDAAIDQGSKQIQMDIIQDVLAPLGSEWAFYLDPTVGGNGLLGFTIVNRLNDAAKMDQSLGKLETTANNIIAGLLRREKVKIAFKQTKVGDTTIHYLAVPLITPSWAIRDGNLYFALYPQVVSSAADHVASKGKSIVSNPDYAKLMKQLGQENPTGVSFFDLPKTAPDAYQTWLLVTRLYLGFGDIFGVDSPPMLLPPLGKILPTLSPAGEVSWVDAEGWHSKAISPFPGSVALAGGGSMGGASVAQAGVMMRIMLPSLNRARETANRVKCASNMRQIGQAMQLYANEHKGKFPNDFGEMLLTQDVTIEVFTCPSSAANIPAEVRQMQPQQQAAWVNANAHYYYLGKGKNNAIDPSRVMIYEKEANHGGDGMNMLFGDGHAEFMSMPAAKKLLAEQGVGKGMGDDGL